MSQLTRLSKDIFSDFFNDYPSLGYLIKPLHGEDLPREFNIDIKENNDEYDIRAELPGVHKDNITITLKDNTITISTEIKQSDKKTKDEKIIKSECYYGSVSRSFSLPSSIDYASSSANYENGILHLLLKKKTDNSSCNLKIN
ncbi:MAG: Hsp20/alpha crystallin family protein [Betaproteobacteria bacterium]|nr:Hsp20/alpha crystallin family protein [Betaproteobacteria bacterium]MDE2424243.1 Hsp20/alpha crystallin family protein [Betaproteobacteria bacterium]